MIESVSVSNATRAMQKIHQPLDGWTRRRAASLIINYSHQSIKYGPGADIDRTWTHSNGISIISSCWTWQSHLINTQQPWRCCCCCYCCCCCCCCCSKCKYRFISRQSPIEIDGSWDGMGAGEGGDGPVLQ